MFTIRSRIPVGNRNSNQFNVLPRRSPGYDAERLKFISRGQSALVGGARLVSTLQVTACTRLRASSGKTWCGMMIFLREAARHSTFWCSGYLYRIFVQCHIKLCGLFNTKSILAKKKQWYYLTHSLGGKRAHNFPESVSWKMNDRARTCLRS